MTVPSPKPADTSEPWVAREDITLPAVPALLNNLPTNADPP